MRGLETEPVQNPQAAGADNRRAQRQKAVLLVCRLVSPAADDLCLISDISEFGARAQTAQRLGVSDRVAFEFGNLFALNGTVRWVRDRQVGVEFDSMAELAPVLQRGRCSPSGQGQAGEATDTRRKRPRIRRCAPVKLYLQGREHKAELHDLSTAGAGIEITQPHPLQAGDWLHCEIEGIDDRTATVRWVDGNRLGVSFDAQLPLRPLDEWLMATVDHCCGCSERQCPPVVRDGGT